MRKTLALVALALAVGGTGTLQAQDAPKCAFLCAPVFVAQPGLLTTNAINAPAGASSATHFLARFTTVVPTTIPRTALVALVQWTPKWEVNNPDGTQTNSNSPAFVFGPVVSLVDLGPLNLSIDGLGVYQPGGETSAYHTTFNMEGIASLGIGHVLSMMGSKPGPYMNGVAINALYDQQLTDVHGKHTPALLFLLTLPIAPLPHSAPQTASAGTR